MKIIPVILEIKERAKYEEIVNYIKDELLPLHLTAFSFFPIFEKIKRFLMLATILPVEFKEDLENSREVKVFQNRIVHALEFPLVPDPYFYKKGFFAAKTNFVTTKQVKELLKIRKDGRGIKIGVVDTGLAFLHEQIRGKRDLIVWRQTTLKLRDESGHGTHVSTIIMGNLSKDEELTLLNRRAVFCEGIAPEVLLHVEKALSFVIGIGTSSDVIKSIERLLNYGVDIINMSLGSDSFISQEQSPYKTPFEELYKNDIIPVCAAGNSGPESGTINEPALLEKCIAIGAYDAITGKVASFSSRGPTKDNLIKPDCIMPGVNIHSGVVGLLDSVDGTYQNYSPLSGTSMAAPFFSGLLASVQEYAKEELGRKLNLDEIKKIMETRGTRKSNEHGWGFFSYQDFVEGIEEVL